MALIVGSSLPEWPTMSALAKLTTTRSKGVSLTAFTAASPIAPALTRRSRGELAGTVVAKFEIDAHILDANLTDVFARVIDHNEWNKELVRDPIVVVLLDARDGIGIRAALGLAVHHGVECLALA